MKAPREIDSPLVEAYLARRALDYLVGFNLSPVLWRKLPGARSAGRVQSVCLRLIVEREMDIEAFNAQEYWSVHAPLKSPRGQIFDARLVNLAGDKLEKFDLHNETQAELAVAAVESRNLHVKSVEANAANRNPYAPFMTSTLQQEASRKFGMGARQTMSVAQPLYEAGHITYGELMVLIWHQKPLWQLEKKFKGVTEIITSPKAHVCIRIKQKTLKRLMSVYGPLIFLKTPQTQK